MTLADDLGAHLRHLLAQPGTLWLGGHDWATDGPEDDAQVVLLRRVEDGQVLEAAIQVHIQAPRSGRWPG